VALWTRRAARRLLQWTRTSTRRAPRPPPNPYPQETDPLSGVRGPYAGCPLPLGTAGLVALGAGPVIYLLGSVAFKIRVIGALWQPRAIAAAVTVGAVAFGSDLPAVAVWALILGILIALAAVEARKTRDFVA
jgi:hypothetical protein